MTSSTDETGDTAASRFAVAEDIGASEALLRLSGELDHDTAPALRTALDHCEDAGSARILVDFSDLRFCDSTGLNVLLQARARAQARDGAVELVGLGRGVSRVFDLTGAATLFPRYPTLAEARSAGGAPQGA
ncbi:STAS domain-containing protein [Streptacidiphilus neutrinimicus]|uniref:STAS domain-containing protein n=1 Tax=Streptacidiphilus neutrinimicus TaxID=105420 RepID=UPI000694D727|nr:STAS domain-containing protein [Streptacidiphilus neutrinimicus]